MASQLSAPILEWHSAARPGGAARTTGSLPHIQWINGPRQDLSQFWRDPAVTPCPHEAEPHGLARMPGVVLSVRMPRPAIGFHPTNMSFAPYTPAGGSITYPAGNGARANREPGWAEPHPLRERDSGVSSH